VLLATWQGERHLPAQLNSLASQRGVEWDLLWRDDGSRDGTVALLNAFAEQVGRTRRLIGPGERLGAARSFMTLLGAVEGEGLSAFCDQDDVWLPDKLSRAADALDRLPRGIPGLYCARQLLVDDALTPIGLSPLLRRSPAFGNALVQNIATGCTVVMNAEARRLALSVSVPPMSMHDWWCYLLVSGCGGTVVFDSQPPILYRQHQTNAVGAAAAPLTRAWRAVQRGPAPFFNIVAQHLDALRQAPLTQPAQMQVKVLQDLTAANPMRRLFSLRRAAVYRQGFAETALLYIWTILHRAEMAGDQEIA